MNVVTIISGTLLLGCIGYTAYKAKENPEQYNGETNPFKILFTKSKNDPEIIFSKKAHDALVHDKDKPKKKTNKITSLFAKDKDKYDIDYKEDEKDTIKKNKINENTEPTLNYEEADVESIISEDSINNDLLNSINNYNAQDEDENE
mgnify:FL=1